MRPPKVEAGKPIELGTCLEADEKYLTLDVAGETKQLRIDKHVVNIHIDEEKTEYLDDNGRPTIRRGDRVKPLHQGSLLVGLSVYRDSREDLVPRPAPPVEEVAPDDAPKSAKKKRVRPSRAKAKKQEPESVAS